MINSKNILRNIGLAVFAGLLLSRCTEPYTPDLGTTYTRLAVEAHVTDDSLSNNFVRITKSSDYLSSTRAAIVSSASVRIIEIKDTNVMDSYDTIAYTFNALEKTYLPPLNFKGKAGYYYKLLVSGTDVDNDGIEESLTSFERMPAKFVQTEYDSISIQYVSQPQFDFFGIQFWAQEPPERNFYVFHKIKNDVRLSDSLPDWGLTDDELYNGNYTMGTIVQNLDNHDSIEAPNVMDTIALEIWNIPESFHTYAEQLVQVTGYQNPLFSGPPANPQDNIKGEKGMGIFAVYSVSRLSTVIKSLPQEALDRREREKDLRN